MVTLFLLSLATAAPEAYPSAAVKSAAAQPNAIERIVCRRITPVGSRLPSRVCRTRGQWREIDEENRRRVREVADDAADVDRGVNGLDRAPITMPRPN